MNQLVTITNNTSKMLSLDLLKFFTHVDCNQLMTLPAGNSEEFEADCYPPQAEKRLRDHCTEQGLTYGKLGLWVVINPLEPVTE